MAHKHGKNGLPIGFYWKRETIYVSIWHERQSIYKGSTFTDDIPKALAFRDAKINEHVKAQDTVLADMKKGVRIGELLDDYIEYTMTKEQDRGGYAELREYETNTYKVKTRIDKNLRPFFGGLKPEELTTEMLKDYKKKRHNQKAGVPTVNTEGRILRAALRDGTQTTPRKVNLIHIPSFDGMINQKVEDQHARDGYIDPATFEKILDNASEHLKPVLVALYYTGIRSREIKLVRRDAYAKATRPGNIQVDFGKHVISLRAGETKESDSRTCGMNDRVEAVLKAWEAQTAEKYPACKWFFHKDGAKLGNWKTAWNATLKRAALRMDDKNMLKFHDTRRTCISDLDGLVEEKDMMANSGHKTAKMSRRYNQKVKDNAAGRVRDAQNKVLGLGDAKTATKATQTPTSDWKAEVKELKLMLDDGTLTAEEFATEKAKVMVTCLDFLSQS